MVLDMNNKTFVIYIVIKKHKKLVINPIKKVQIKIKAQI